MYNIGTIKLVWYSNNDYKVINSLMFNSVNEALIYSKNLSNFMIMKLTSNEADFYKWEVLEYGDFNKYKSGMFINKYFFAVLIISFIGFILIKK
tara:strand:+ start:891 stop:1172 length:282 start_codon:yes stop_codon:yes gene_type:complete